MTLKGRNLLKMMDFTPEEILYLVDLSAELKDKKKKGIPVDTLRGKNVALIFEKTSTRTRCSFEEPHMISAWEPPILTRPVPRSVKKRASKIRPAFLQECMRELSTVDLVRKL